jgi:hypothetical protein
MERKLYYSNIDLKLYLEGIEYPIIGLSVSSVINQDVQANITIPIPDFVTFLPRTLGFVFFNSNENPIEEEKERLESLKKDLEEAQKDLVTLNRYQKSYLDFLVKRFQELMKYKLLFLGQLISYSIERTVNGLQAVLVFAGLISYLDLVKKYYYAPLSFQYEKLKSAIFLDATPGAYDIVLGSGVALASLIRKEHKTFEGAEGIHAGFLNVIEYLCGFDETGFIGNSNPDNIVSDYFVMANLRNKILNNIVITPGDKSSSLLLSTKQFYDYIRALVDQYPGYSLRELFETLLSLIFYQLIPVPTPNIIDLTKLGPKKIEKKIEIKEISEKDEELLNEIYSELERLIGSLSSKIECFNISKRSTSSKNTKVKKLVEKFNRIVECYHTFIYNQPVENNFPARINDANIINDAKKLEDEINELLKSPRKKIVTKTIYKELSKSKAVNSYLTSYTLLPNIFMSDVPLCNIITPDMIESFTFSDNMLAAPTRKMIITPKYIAPGVSSSDMAPVIGHFYTFSPRTTSIYGKSMQEHMAKNERFLMNHELFTGPIPSIERFQDIRTYDPLLGISGKSVGKAIQEKVVESLDKLINEEERKMSKKLKISLATVAYLTFYTNMKFIMENLIKFRITVRTVFNPYIIPGLPALIIENDDPNNRRIWYGVPVAVSHDIDVSGRAYTTIEFQYARFYKYLGELFNYHFGKTTKSTGSKKSTKKSQQQQTTAGEPSEEELKGLKNISVQVHRIIGYITQIDELQSKLAKLDKNDAEYKLTEAKFDSLLKELKDFDVIEDKNLSESKNTEVKLYYYQYKAILYGKPPFEDEGIRSSIKSSCSYLVELLDQFIQRYDKNYAPIKGSSGYNFYSLEIFNNLAPEDAVRAFLDKIFLNDQIGEKVYTPLFGTRSLHDFLQDYFNQNKNSLNEEERAEFDKMFGEKAKAENYDITTAADLFVDKILPNLANRNIFEFIARPIASAIDVFQLYDFVFINVLIKNEIIEDFKLKQQFYLSEVYNINDKYASKISEPFFRMRNDYRKSITNILNKFYNLPVETTKPEEKK